MYVPLLSFITASLMALPHTGTLQGVRCAITVAPDAQNLVVKPNVIGPKGTVGRHETVVQAAAGTNRSTSVQSGGFTIHQTDVLQAVATLHLSLDPARRIDIHVQIFSQGQISKCIASYP